MADSTRSASADASRDLSELVALCGPELLEVLEHVRAFRRQAPTPERSMDFETAIGEQLREVGRVLVEVEYNRIEPRAVEDCPMRLGLAGEEYKRRPKSPNSIGTLFGSITLRRYLYEPLEPGERSIFPLEMALGIEAGLATPALAEWVGRQVADHSQDQVLEALQRDHGVGWSVKSLRKLGASLSAGLASFRQEAQVQQLLELLKKAERSSGRHCPVLAVGRDGIMVPIRDEGYQEAATATLSVSDRKGRRLGTVYLGRMPESGQGETSRQLTALLRKVLSRWQGGRLQLAYITDGGHHQQAYFEEVLSRMEDPKRPGQQLQWQWILDFWHACGYLGKLKEALFGESASGWWWFRRMRRWLQGRHNGITQVLRSATQHWNRHGRISRARRQLFWEAYRYLRRHVKWMNYARYRGQGLPIGSGVTEAACKIVFTQRLKQSGMSWDVEGGQVVVDLRVLRLSGIWSKAYRAYQRSRPQPKVIRPASDRPRRGASCGIAA
jgi:hypothetical protein